MNPQDPSNFRQMLLDSPDQFRVGFEIAKDIRIDGDFQAIEISGMGGSALPGNLLRIYLSDLFKKTQSQEGLSYFRIDFIHFHMRHLRIV